MASANQDNCKTGMFSAIRRKRVYVGIIIAIGTALVSCCLWKPPLNTLTAEATLRHRILPLPPQIDTAAPAVEVDLCREIMREDFLTSVANRMKQGVEGEALHTPDEMALWFKDVHSKLQVSGTPIPNQPGFDYELSYVGQNGKFAVALLDGIVNESIARFHHPGTNDTDLVNLHSTKQAADQLKQQLQSFDHQIRQFVSNELAQRRREFEAIHPQVAAPAIPPGPEPSNPLGGSLPRQTNSHQAISLSGGHPNLPQVQEVNPEWEELERSLTQAENDLEALQLTYTASHPLVVRAQREVRALKLQLVETPRLNNVDVGDVTHNPKARANQKLSSDDNLNQLTPPEPPPVFDEYAVRNEIEQSQAYLKMLSERARIETNHDEAVSQLGSLPLSDGTQRAEVIVAQTPTIASRSFRIDRGIISRLLLCSGIVGVIFGLLQGRMNIPPTFYSTQDVEDSLPLPITGTLQAFHENELPQPTSTGFPNLTRWAVKIGEVLVVAGILFALFQCCTSRSFLPRLMSEPLTAYLDAIQQAKASIFHW